MTPGDISKAESDIGVIGGGRWARTIAKVLLELKLEGRNILVCSPGHPGGWITFKENLEDRDRYRIEAVSTVENLLSADSVETVVIARSAKNHARTAISALEAGKDCFIEKPFALSLSEADQVVAAAKGRRCFVGLVFLFAENLRLFANATANLGELHHLDIVWTDPCVEHRGGEAKRYDASINVLQDVFPHVWSIIALLLDPQTLRSPELELDGGGRIVKLRLAASTCDISVHIERDATYRRRFLRCDGANGRSQIDFSSEPGKASVNGEAIDIGRTFKSPLQRELCSFLGLSEEAWPIQFAHVDQAIQTVSLIDPLRCKIEEYQLATIRAGLHDRAMDTDRHAAKFALRELQLGLENTRFG
jgi:predicted dehydrogenase